QLEDAIRQRRLPMVDVGDDREVAYPVLAHAQTRLTRVRKASNAPSSRTRSSLALARYVAVPTASAAATDASWPAKERPAIWSTPYQTANVTAARSAEAARIRPVESAV